MNWKLLLKLRKLLPLAVDLYESVTAAIDKNELAEIRDDLEDLLHVESFIETLNDAMTLGQHLKAAVTVAEWKDIAAKARALWAAVPDVF